MFGWAVDGEPFCFRLRSLGLRQNNLENAVLERGLDLIFINVHADRNLPFESARGRDPPYAPSRKLRSGIVQTRSDFFVFAPS